MTLATFMRMVWSFPALLGGAAILKVVEPPVDFTASITVGLPGLRIPISSTSVSAVLKVIVMIPAVGISGTELLYCTINTLPIEGFDSAVVRSVVFLVFNTRGKPPAPGVYAVPLGRAAALTLKPYFFCHSRLTYVPAATG